MAMLNAYIGRPILLLHGKKMLCAEIAQTSGSLVKSVIIACLV